MKTLQRSGMSAALAIVLAAPAAAGAAGDPARGMALFQKTCGVCHSIDAGVNKVGPSLFDILGRPIASVRDYNYSSSMAAASRSWKVWNARNLDAYLANPRQVLKGVKMFYAVPEASDRADVIEYLRSLQ